MDMGLQGRVIVITGAARGIGRACAELAVAEGADRLVLTDRDAVAARMPLRRMLTAAETARLAIFLLGDDSIPMSGSVVDFDQFVAGANG